MGLNNKTIDEGNKSAEMQAIKFYENINFYHKRVDKVLKLIQDYFDQRKAKCEKEFMAIKIVDGLINKSTRELTDDIKSRIGYWFRNEKIELEDSIYTIEFFGQIFFCKIFEFDENNMVLAGYVLKDTALVRTFISKFSEKRIQEKYEKILAII